MFRITRGHQVQHIHFPVPVMRDLDDLESDEPREDAAPEAGAPTPATDAAGEADASPGTVQ